MDLYVKYLVSFKLTFIIIIRVNLVKVKIVTIVAFLILVFKLTLAAYFKYCRSSQLTLTKAFYDVRSFCKRYCPNGISCRSNGKVYPFTPFLFLSHLVDHNLHEIKIT